MNTTRLVGVTTVLSGAGLLAAPRTSLELVGAGTADPAPYLFRIVGMFMVLSGGLLVDGGDQPLALRWSAAQKAGAATAMTLGVVSGNYRRRALAVAAFDGLSGLVILAKARHR